MLVTSWITGKPVLFHAILKYSYVKSSHLIGKHVAENNNHMKTRLQKNGVLEVSEVNRGTERNVCYVFACFSLSEQVRLQLAPEAKANTSPHASLHVLSLLLWYVVWQLVLWSALTWLRRCYFTVRGGLRRCVRALREQSAGSPPQHRPRPLFR